MNWTAERDWAGRAARIDPHSWPARSERAPAGEKSRISETSRTWPWRAIRVGRWGSWPWCLDRVEAVILPRRLGEYGGGGGSAKNVW